MFFGESGKVVHQIHLNDMPHNNALDLVTIRHQTMHRLYTGTAYPYEFASQEDPLRTLTDIAKTKIYVRDSCKIGFKDAEAGVQCRKSHIRVDAFGPDPTVSAAIVLSNMHQAEWEALIPESGSQIISDTEEVIPTKADPAVEISNLGIMQPTKVDTAISRASATCTNAGKPFHVWKFSREICESDWSKPRRDHGDAVCSAKLLYEHLKKHRFTIKRNEFDYTRGVLTVKLCSVLDTGEQSIEALLMDDEVHERLELLI